jgi:TAZ zinc finger
MNRKHCEKSATYCHFSSCTSGAPPTIAGLCHPTNELVLRRMEEVILVWYYRIIQIIETYQAEISDDNSSLEEDIHTLQFCTTVLMKTITGGNIKNIHPDTSTPLWQRPLPPIHQLPYMVTTIQYWYCHHLSLYRHQTVVGKIKSKLFPPNDGQPLSFEQYVSNCENSMKQWIGDTAVLSNSGSNMTLAPPDSIIDQHLKSDDVDSAHTPNLKGSTKNCSTSDPSANEMTFSSPTTTVTVTIDVVHPNSISDSSNFDAEPDVTAIQLRKNPATDATAEPRNGKLDNRQARWCGLVLNLYHAWKCPFNDSACTTLATRSCTIQRGCRAANDLYQHIRDGTCNSLDCVYGTLCEEATDAIQHFQNCQSESCSICGPVMRHIPHLNQAIKDAPIPSVREVECAKDAQRTFTKDTVKVHKSITNMTSIHRPTTLRHKFASVSPPSPLIPRTIAAMKRSVDIHSTNDEIGQRPAKLQYSSKRHSH